MKANFSFVIAFCRMCEMIYENILYSLLQLCVIVLLQKTLSLCRSLEFSSTIIHKEAKYFTKQKTIQHALLPFLVTLLKIKMLHLTKCMNQRGYPLCLIDKTGGWGEGGGECS